MLYMPLNLIYHCLPPFSQYPFPYLLKSIQSSSTPNSPSFFLNRISPQINVSRTSTFSPKFTSLNSKASVDDGVDEVTQKHIPCNSELLADDLINLVSGSKDSNGALEVIDGISGRNAGVVSTSDCRSIIVAAIRRNNSDLALSIFDAMRSSFDQAVVDNDNPGRWRWPRPDVHIYISLIHEFATSLKVSDALRVLTNASWAGVSPGEEVLFGKVVRCPSCFIAITVAQPQHGIQIASCFKCRYKYELVSGTIVSIESKKTSIDALAWKKGLSFFQIVKPSIPAAVHSIVVETPSGTAQTHRFGTKTVDLPAQNGERVTIALAAPSHIYTELGPFKLTPKPTNLYPGEPMSLTNHHDGRQSLLLRKPLENGTFSLLNPSFFVPLSAVLATGDAATAIIDPSLPKFIAVGAIASVALGAAINMLVLPQLNRLPKRRINATMMRQELLSQYDRLQCRIKDLKQSAEKEVWLLARMCQLENKIIVVGEPSYCARRSRVKRVKETLETSLSRRIEQINSYARISSMIEIEVEMDSDVLDAEAATGVGSIAEQIEQMMELEKMEEKWRMQAEANEEVERLLSSETI